jgi:putative molybdopterin biosynthesis protein
MAADRWRVLEQEPAQSQIDVLRFVGSHDMAITLVAAQFQEINPRFSIQLTFSGSLNGLIALAEKNADLAGCHLWDEESDTYNTAFVRRILPGQSIALLTLAHRNVGLIVGFDNPKDICSLSDLVRSGVQFVNRQMGSGTRVWLDAHLRKLGISGEQIQGYGQEKMTHTEVAAAVMKTEADAGLGVQTAALALGLEFIPLTTERYDLAIPEGKWQSPAIQVLARWLKTAQAKAAIANLGGYGVAETGRIEWVQ